MIDAYASLPHYAAHIGPIWAELPPRVRGTFWVPQGMARHLREDGIEATLGRPKGTDPIIIAGFADMKATAGRRAVFVEHGAGQTYGANHPSYPGGAGRGRVALFVCPSERVAKANLDRYPSSRAIVVGCPRLDRLHMVPPSPAAGVAVAFHWRSGVCPEAGTAFDYYADAVAELARTRPVFGTGHPRMWDELEPFYRRVGIEPVRRLEDLARKANVLVLDNSSLGWEWMSLDRPLVWLNAPNYRRGIEHGLRFWEFANSGVGCDSPADLADAVALAVADEPDQRERRRTAVGQVYGFCDGHAAERAAEAIVSMLKG